MAQSGDNAKKALVGELNGLLADHLALYIKTKNFHWHVAGPRFRDLHLLFDEHAIELRDQLLGIAVVANQSQQSLERTAQLYFDLIHRLELPAFAAALGAYTAETHWQALAIEGLEDLLASSPLAICQQLLSNTDSPALDSWQTRNAVLLERWQQLCKEIRGLEGDIALFSVAASELKALSSSS